MMRYLLLSILLSFSPGCFSADHAMADSTLYHEEFRPRYHFTPAHRWIGDPCGTILLNGQYLAYSWGAVSSPDLIHWNEINDHAIKGLPSDVSAFTGSVVADRKNTAGYGEDALIAVFTSFDEISKKQSQSIAFSHDGGATFSYYDRNPVIDIWSTEFRDPTVIWDEQSDRWVMVVAKALEKKVVFYGSDDLKNWTWLSEFGPMGDSEKSWECPDLFQLPVEDSDKRKWVLVVSVNWAREQYFTGDFDGTRFIPDSPDSAPLYVDDGLDYYASRVFRNFDDPKSSEVYSIGWVNTWDYATSAPSSWGKGIWSFPRKLSLYRTTDGLRLRQTPLDRISSLRSAPVTVRYNKLAPGIVSLNDIRQMGNVYEMHVRFDLTDNDIVGLNLCEGAGRKVTVSYDSSSRHISVDRTNSTHADIPKFDRIAYAKIPDDRQGCLDLTILVDKSLVEIFVNDGKSVFSLLTFSPEEAAGAEVFSLRGCSGVSIDAWQLKSIWD